MATTHNIGKSLAVVEDIAVGRGTVLQKRGRGTEVDMHVVAESAEALVNIDTAKYTRARVYSGTAYVDYVYLATKWELLTDNFSFVGKIFQSPTDGGLTEIQTRTVDANGVYEVRKTSDNSLATIYSDAAGAIEIVQNGTSNVSDSGGVVEFYIADGDYYIDVDSESVYFDVVSDAPLGGKNTTNLPPLRQIHTAYELTATNTVSEQYLRLKSIPTTLSYIELIAPPVDMTTTTFVVDMDVLSGVVDVDFTFNLTHMDDMDRTNSAQKATSYVYENGKFYVTQTNSGGLPNFAAFSVRALTAQGADLKIRSVSIVDGYTTIAKSEFNLIAEGADRNIVITDNIAYKMNIAISTVSGYIVSDHVIAVSPKGSSEIFNPPYSLDFWRDFIEVHSSTSKLANKIVFNEGDYYRYRNRRFLTIPRDLTLIGIGSVRFLAGREIPTSTWESLSASAGVTAYKAPYDVTNNPDGAIRAGNKQPFVASTLREDINYSIRNYQQQRVNSIAEVLATPYRSYFDGTDLYFSFDATFPTAYVSVAECDNGLAFESPSTPYNLNMVNIDVLYPKVKCYALSPATYKTRQSGGKFLSFHNCSAVSSYSNAGFSNDNIDQEQIDCYTDCTNTDGYNYHYDGLSLIVNSVSKSAGDDSMGHHETCVGEVHGFKSLYPAAAHSVPAFGAKAVHYDCQGIAAKEGLSGKPYESSWASLAGQGTTSYAEYNNCKSLNGEYDYTCSSQESGMLSELVINKPVTQEHIKVNYNGPKNDLSVYGDFIIKS